MHVLIAGVCGFVGSHIAAWLVRNAPSTKVIGIDSFVRAGSETNRIRLKALGVEIRHGDVRNVSDVESLPDVDWIVDAAANPSVTAGLVGATSTRQLVEHNLLGTLHLLESCKRMRAGFVLLSTSRVYSISALSTLPVTVRENAFELDTARPWPVGLSTEGIGADFSTEPPISLYGATKLASEVLALEYGSAFAFPVWIDRCGVLAGAGQFGTAEQGIFSYWVHAYARKRVLRFIGFGGRGHQVRDGFHPDDLADLIYRQMRHRAPAVGRVFNVGGGHGNAISLAQLSAWCAERLGPHAVTADDARRPFDVPWVVMDSAAAESQFGWRPAKGLLTILEEIAAHAERNPDWLEMIAAT